MASAHRFLIRSPFLLSTLSLGSLSKSSVATRCIRERKLIFCSQVWKKTSLPFSSPRRAAFISSQVPENIAQSRSFKSYSQSDSRSDHSVVTEAADNVDPEVGNQDEIDIENEEMEDIDLSDYSDEEDDDLDYTDSEDFENSGEDGDEFWDDEDFSLETERLSLKDVPWSKGVVAAAESVLAQPKFGSDLEIFSIGIVQKHSLIRVRIDKLSDRYGSPSMTEIEDFSRDFQAEVDKVEGIPSDVAFEVSTPGADREVRMPKDLERFKSLPMLIAFVESSSGELVERVVDIVDFDVDNGITVWKLANVKANREAMGKGRQMNKKQRDWRVNLKLDEILSVRLHFDF